MRKVILASHGMLAKGMLDSVLMIAGNPLIPVQAFTLEPGQNPMDFARQVEIELQQQPDTFYDIVTDLYGASVSSAFYPLSQYANVRIYTGMNLGLVLALVLAGSQALSDEEAEDLVEQAQQGVKILRYEKTQDDDF